MTSEIKPSVTLTQVLALLEAHFAGPVTQLAPVEAGQVAKTFSFEVAGQAYIIRFNSSALAKAFAKEQYIARRYASDRIPIPVIEHLGQFQNFSYAISHKLPGVTADKLPPAEFKQLIPALMETLAAIHRQDVRHKTNFGSFDEHGIGTFSSWRASLASIREEESGGDFYGKWRRLFDETFLERDFFDAVYAPMAQRLIYCPEERYLLHGDYGFDNLLVDQGQISGVLDWPNAKYGDFLYDVAWLDFWAPGVDFQGRFHHYYLAHNQAVPYYEQRIRCYQYYIGLEGLRFFAKTNNEPAYQWVRRRILDGGEVDL